MESAPRSLISPQALEPGMTVALVCPASPPKDSEGWSLAERQLVELGFCVRLSRLAAEILEGKHKGTHRERARDLLEVFADPSVDAVWAIRGGYGCLPLLPFIDWDVIEENPKPLLGFSDITVLLLSVHQRTGLVTFHAPMPVEPLTEPAVGELRRVVGEPRPAGVVPKLSGPRLHASLPETPVTVAPGKAEGSLLAGNLFLMARLLGTPFEPDFRGRILCIEDIGEEPYRVHGAFSQMLLAGRLQELAGIAIGTFVPNEGSPSQAELAALREVFEDCLRGLQIPVWWGLPLGHVDTQTVLPIGVRARIDADLGVLEILDAAVS